MSTFGLSINQAMTVEKEATEEKAFSVCASIGKRKKVYSHRSIEICIGEIKESSDHLSESESDS